VLESVDPAVDPGLAGYLLIQREMASANAGLGIRWDVLARGVELEARGLEVGGGKDPSALRHVRAGGPPLLMYTQADRIDDVRRRFVVEDAWYAERGEEGWRAERQALRAVAELRAGDPLLATRLADVACETLERIGAQQAWPVTFAWRSLVDAHLGRLERARSTIDRTIAEQVSDGSRFWLAVLESVSGFVAHAASDEDTAERAVGRMRALMGSIGVAELLGDRSEGYLVEVRVSRGDLEGAREAVQRLEARHRALPRAWTAIALQRGRALLLAADGELGGALDALDATDPADLRRLPFEHGWTLLARGRILRRMRERIRAAAALREARDRFVAVGGLPWIVAADHELARVGLRHRSPNELTATELEVARLAARGLSNREMAEAAFVSPKTIEANLSRIYRKLGIRSRAELGGWVRERQGFEQAET
jgi:DNA-binding CsgD family transcriptional regulator